MSDTLNHVVLQVQLPHSTTLFVVEETTQNVIGKFVNTKPSQCQPHDTVECFNRPTDVPSVINQSITTEVTNFSRTLEQLLPLFYDGRINVDELPLFGIIVTITQGFDDENDKEYIVMFASNEYDICIGEYAIENTSPKIIVGLWKSLFIQEALTA